MMRKSADRRDKGYGTREAKEMLAVIHANRYQRLLG